MVSPHIQRAVSLVGSVLFCLSGAERSEIYGRNCHRIVAVAGSGLYSVVPMSVWSFNFVDLFLPVGPRIATLLHSTIHRSVGEEDRGRTVSLYGLK